MLILLRSARVAIDRPGSGGTPACPLTERVETATKQTLSILEHLDLLNHPNLSILAHSAGVLYSLALIPHLPVTARPVRLVLSSPWVPTHLSGGTLRFMPSALVTLTPRAFPLMSKALGGWSDSWQTATSTLTTIARSLPGGFGAVKPSTLISESEVWSDEKAQARDEVAKANGKKLLAGEIKRSPKDVLPTIHFKSPYLLHSTGPYGLDSLMHDEGALHPATGRKLWKADGNGFIFCLSCTTHENL